MYLRRHFPLRQSFLGPFKSKPSSKFVQTSAVIAGDREYTLPLDLTGDGNLSYSKLLSLCCQTRALSPGVRIHAHLIKIGVSDDAKHRNHLINLYSKCRVFRDARKMLDESPEPDLVGWSALISGYSQCGLGRDAISAFREMHLLGIKCNEFTFPSVLKSCSISDLVLGKQIHGIVVVTGFESDVYVANSLVVMYAKSSEYLDSMKLFNLIPERNVVSWNALISCFTRGDFFGEAMALFHDMVISGIRPDEYSLSNIINACTGLSDMRQGKKIHGYLMKLGYDSDPFSSNALVDMYAKVGKLEDAIEVFKQIPNPDIVSWNALIAGCVLNEHNDMALAFLEQMKRSGEKPNMFTLSSALKACAGLGLHELGRQLHSNLVKSDVGFDPFLSVGLIDIYAKCGAMDDAMKVYGLMPEEDVIALNALISGYSENENDDQAVSLFADMHKRGMAFNETTLVAILNSAASLQAVTVGEQVHAHSVKVGFQSDPFVVNSLINCYGKCRCLEMATRAFEESPVGDLATITSMISSYAQYGQGEEAMKLYLKMQNMELKPDSFVCSSLLNAAASLSAYEQGKQIHVHALKFGFTSDVFTANSLVNMYATCGSIDDANRAFSEVPERGLVSWSAMIGGLAQHGHGKEALRLFDEMLKAGVSPNHVTLVSVLCACNHAGLVTQAKRYFDTMKEIFGIEPTQEHYACMIDILGRAGKLDEAMDLVKNMPFEANGSVWGALLGAARIHKNVELGQKAAEKLLAIEPEKSGTHVLLANIYASAGLWERVADVRRSMRESKVKKEPGMSWIEVKDRVYTFIVGDRSHSRSEEIYAKLGELMDLIAKAGYVPAFEVDLHNVKRSEKEILLSYHSEKLAVAFGLIATPPGAPIRVKKNLRVCVDCHTSFKFISSIVSREIIVRDINRFHHFKDGSCSCSDYW